ncbi:MULTISPECIES: hypothetical protein [Chelatococcus]|uniref:Uncharacterized protein n=1 Tax=Chelatococcus caeni TaxID=1348468 RepID=A0A840C7R2_9HYPH|nr:MULTISPECIES: hypothetical protein [Chelatococcus]MBB4019449.1 hypothetical protein [Chelatococcus caeni]
MLNDLRTRPKPVTTRAQSEARENAFRRFLFDTHPAYHEWREKRDAASFEFQIEAERKFPNPASADKAEKEHLRLLRAWVRRNPNPLYQEEIERLREEFDRAYRPTRWDAIG